MNLTANASGRRRSLLAFGCTGVLALALGGCGVFGKGGSQQRMASGSENIAGQGTVAAVEGENGNTEVEVEVEHLADPAKLDPESNTYVVWIRPPNGQVQNVGALDVDDDLVGRLETVTPHREFTLMVTPEPSPRADRPTNEPVFSSEVARTNR